LFAGSGVPELGLQRGDFVVVQFAFPLKLFQLKFLFKIDILIKINNIINVFIN
jgi:hypothetical protein